jgi:hypothetical protein
MRHISENFKNSTRVSGLYCVWVPVHDDGGNRLVSIWIDRAMTAFTSDGSGTAATCFTEHQQEDVELVAEEHLPSIPSPRS